MNFTGNVILGLFYVLPGIVFVFGLTRLFSSKSPSPFDGQLSTGFILALPSALLMHAIGIGAAYFVSWLFGTAEPAPEQALTLLLGDPKSTTSAVAKAGASWIAIAAYFLFLTPVSWGLGKVANKWVKPNRRADWYDLLRHKADMLWLTTDVEIGGVAHLFAGVLKDFRLSSDGELERVVLMGAVRRPLMRPTEQEIASGEENYQDGGWIPIPGEHVVLKLSGSNTFSVDYWYLEDEAPDEGEGQLYAGANARQVTPDGHDLQ